MSSSTNPGCFYHSYAVTVPKLFFFVKNLEIFIIFNIFSGNRTKKITKCNILGECIKIHVKYVIGKVYCIYFGHMLA